MTYVNPYGSPSAPARYATPYGRGAFASAEGTIAGPWQVTNGDTLVTRIVVNAAPATSTATISAAAASETASNSEPYALDGTSLTLRFSEDATDNVTVNFAAGDPWTVAEVVAAVNAAGPIGGLAFDAGTEVNFASSQLGSGARFRASGTALAVLGLTGTANGSGNVADANIGGATPAEMRTIAQAAADAASQRVRFYVTSDNRIGVHTLDEGGAVSLDIVSTSTLDDELGLDNDEHDGADAASVLAMRLGPVPVAMPLTSLLGGGG